MKKNNYKFLLAIACFGFLASCNDDDDATDARIVKPVVTASQISFDIVEGETAPLELTVNTPYFRTMEFKLELVGGTASFRDYNVDNGDETTIDDGMGMIGHKIVFPAYATTATFDITPYIDYLPEGTETMVLKLSSMGNANGLVAEGSDIITITVGNSTLDEVQSDLTWASTTNAHGNIVDIEYLGADDAKHSVADVDFDLLVFGPANIFTGATGDHPEYAKIASTRPNGYYDFYVDLYETPSGPVSAGGNGLAKFKRPTAFYPKVTISKPGVWVHTFDLKDIWTSEDPGSVSGATSDVWVGYVQKSGTTFTLFDTLDEELATGRSGRKVMPRNAIRTK